MILGCGFDKTGVIERRKEEQSSISLVKALAIRKEITKSGDSHILRWAIHVETKKGAIPSCFLPKRTYNRDKI